MSGSLPRPNALINTRLGASFTAADAPISLLLPGHWTCDLYGVRILLYLVRGLQL